MTDVALQGIELNSLEFIYEQCKLIGYSYEYDNKRIPIYECRKSFKSIMKEDGEIMKFLIESFDDDDKWFETLIKQPAFSMIVGIGMDLIDIIFIDENIAYYKYIKAHEYAHCIYNHFTKRDVDQLELENEADIYAKNNFIRIPKLENFAGILANKIISNYEYGLSLELFKPKDNIFRSIYPSVNTKNYKTELKNSLIEKLKMRDIFNK